MLGANIECWHFNAEVFGIRTSFSGAHPAWRLKRIVEWVGQQVRTTAGMYLLTEALAEHPPEPMRRPARKPARKAAKKTAPRRARKTAKKG
ncbi:hypothetical protein DRW03_33225 [Corallococcus sp. H22C18031201]|nr:hypothetical protein DRW03_33225 [Corallococcus sp. H22C18031201]